MIEAIEIRRVRPSSLLLAETGPGSQLSVFSSCSFSTSLLCILWTKPDYQRSSNFWALVLHVLLQITTEHSELLKAKLLRQSFHLGIGFRGQSLLENPSMAIRENALIALEYLQTHLFSVIFHLSVCPDLMAFYRLALYIYAVKCALRNIFLMRAFA